MSFGDFHFEHGHIGRVLHLLRFPDFGDGSLRFRADNQHCPMYRIARLTVLLQDNSGLAHVFIEHAVRPSFVEAKVSKNTLQFLYIRSACRGATWYQSERDDYPFFASVSAA